MDTGEVFGVREEVLQVSLGFVPSPEQDVGEEAGDAEWGEDHVGPCLLYCRKSMVEPHGEIGQSLPQHGLC